MAALSSIPSGVNLAVMAGHPSEPGAYVVRVKVPDGTKLMPHTHPEDRIYTVMSGVFFIGLRDRFDGDKVRPIRRVGRSGELRSIALMKPCLE